MDDIKIGAAYVRVSTTDQVEYSPDSQIKLIRDFAKRDGYIIPDEYVYQDDGISGKSADKRPAFRLMIATAKEDNHPFDCIFVWKYSRFARNQEEAIMYKNLLRKKKVEVKSISEPSSDSPFSSLIERIIEWMDEYYLINLAGEVRRGMKEKSLRGEAMGKAPFGYDVKGKILVPNENADVVRWIFEQYVAGECFRGISNKLYDSSVLSSTGKRLDMSAIQYILCNPAYIGKTRWSDEDHGLYRYGYTKEEVDKMVDGKHDPLISVELWEAAQKKLLSRESRVKYERPGKPVFMLKGLLRCGSCGQTLVSCTSLAKKESLRLQCCGYMRGQCKVSHFVIAEKADAAVIEGLEQAIGSRTFTFAPQKPPESKIARDWDKLIGQEQTRLERARTALLDGAFTSDEYKSVKASVEENISRLEKARKKDAPVHVDKNVYQKKVVEVLSLLKSPDVSGEAKNIALRSIVDKIVFNKPENTFDIYFAP